MSKELGDIDYNEEEYLNLGADYPETKNNPVAELHIIDLTSRRSDVGSQTSEVRCQMAKGRYQKMDVGA